jgi:hypothetical protein
MGDMCGRYRLTRSRKYLEEHFYAYGEVEVSLIRLYSLCQGFGRRRCKNLFRI